MARRNFFLFKNVYLLSRGKKAAGPLADLEGGKAAKLIAGWILPRMMRLAFSRAVHDTTLPRQRDHVIRPQCCWLLRCCVVVNAKLKILACGALVFSITNKKQHSFCSNSMVNFFLTLATTSFPSSFLWIFWLSPCSPPPFLREFGPYILSTVFPNNKFPITVKGGGSRRAILVCREDSQQYVCKGKTVHNEKSFGGFRCTVLDWWR